MTTPDTAPDPAIIPDPATAPETAPETPETPDESTTETEARGGFLRNILAAVSTKGELIAERDHTAAALTEARAALAERDTHISAIMAESRDLTAQLAHLRAERAEITAALDAAAAAAAAANAAGVDAVAAIGFREGALPAAEAAEDSPAALEAALEACRDPQEIFRLNAKLKARRLILPEYT